jgi:hypothetical protein
MEIYKWQWYNFHVSTFFPINIYKSSKYCQQPSSLNADVLRYVKSRFFAARPY